jgi:2-oxoglutarate ferredoxin oxidoreductase subunit alpha
MAEGLSALAAAELPSLVVDVQRGGPGLGTTQTAQTDYRQATKGAGHGGYQNIVLAPATAQEMFDFTQLGFYLADKYRHLTLMLTDGMLGQMMESVELKVHNWGPLPPKDWALLGTERKGGRDSIVSSLKIEGMCRDIYGDYLERMREKYRAMQENELRWETYRTEDADLVVVAYGSSARIAMEAVDEARAEGRRVGVFRPITLWPFPKKQIRELAEKVNGFLVVEDSLGQMVEDVEAAVAERAPVHFLGILARDDKRAGGMILPERVLNELRELT